MSEVAPESVLDIVGAAWREQAACADPSLTPTRWFFPRHERESDLNVRHARVVCASCPVKRPCLDRALVDSMPGIYAGTSRTQRRPYLRDAKDAELKPAIVEELLEVARASTIEGLWRVGIEEDWTA